MNTNAPIIIVVIVFLIALVGGGVYFSLNEDNQNKEVPVVDANQQKITSTTSDIKIEKNNIEEKIPAPSSSVNPATPPVTQNTSPCHITEDKRGCARNDFKIITPNGGEQLCTLEETKIEWNAPKDVEAVTLKLREVGIYGKEYKVGTFPASYNEEGLVNGKGSVMWKVPPIPEGMVYEMWINTVYKGSSVNDVSDGVFSIVNCRG